LPLADGSIDLLVCYHILEHVEDDTSAMREIRRVLQPGGVALIQTPFKEGDIDEDPTVRSPQERAARFGQWDHVRNYSTDGLARRLELQGFTVEQRHFDTGRLNDQGLAPSETVLIARPA
jgi:SAM-dependent methyltransferase